MSSMKGRNAVSSQLKAQLGARCVYRRGSLLKLDACWGLQAVECELSMARGGALARRGPHKVVICWSQEYTLLVALLLVTAQLDSTAQLNRSWLKMRLAVNALRGCSRLRPCAPAASMSSSPRAADACDSSARRRVVPSGVPPAPTSEMRDVPGPALVPLSSLLKYRVKTTGTPGICARGVRGEELEAQLRRSA